MNPETIRRIDVGLGKPGCAVLTLVRRLLGLFTGGAPAAEPPRKILFIKMIEQGATVLAYPALKKAAERVGRENVFFWVFEKNRAILDVLDVVSPENVLALRSDRFPTFVSDVLRALQRIRRERIDTTIDMEFFTRAPAILAYLSGARRRVGLHRFTSEGPYRGDLLTHRVQYNPYLHAAAAYDVLVEAAFAVPGEVPMLKQKPPRETYAPPPFVPGQEEVDAVQRILDEVAGRRVERPIVLLNPNASDMLPIRKWPTDRFVELGRRILDAYPRVTLALTGAPAEAGPAAGIASQIGSERVVCMAGKTTLRQVIVLYTLAELMVTNDSGPAHFSSLAANMDTIVMYGPETPLLFGPLGERAQVLASGLACSPCVNVFNHRFSPCTDNRCMQAISVDAVFEKVRDALGKRGY
ncbi:MAG: glycosyltransferase family 9 protein [Kiritimatiellae bacterium]|nr:glycosyltransferase family 9 protein [Kiritimatiellia bacterium]